MISGLVPVFLGGGGGAGFLAAIGLAMGAGVPFPCVCGCSGLRGGALVACAFPVALAAEGGLAKIVFPPAIFPPAIFPPAIFPPADFGGGAAILATAGFCDDARALFGWGFAWPACGVAVGRLRFGTAFWGSRGFLAEGCFLLVSGLDGTGFEGLVFVFWLFAAEAGFALADFAGRLDEVTFPVFRVPWGATEAVRLVFFFFEGGTRVSPSLRRGVSLRVSPGIPTTSMLSVWGVF
jgi:hypothetical protein